MACLFIIPEMDSDYCLDNLRMLEEVKEANTARQLKVYEVRKNLLEDVAEYD